MSREYGGSIRKLPSGRYQARILGPDGRHYPLPVTYPDLASARIALSREVRRRDRCYEEDVPWTPPTQTRARVSLTLRVYADEVLGERGLKRTTQADYKRLRSKWGDLSDMQVDAITPDVVAAWWDARTRRIARTNAKSYILLRSVLARAVTDKRFRMRENPCQIERAGRVKAKPKAPVVTLTELDAIVAEMPERWRLAVLLGVWCIPRWGELAALRRRDVLLEPHPTLRITRGVSRVDGEWVIDTPKSASGRRDVAIPPHIVPALTEHLDRRVGKDPGALLFPSESGTFLHEAVFYRAWNRARRAAGRPDLRFHDLRGSGATWAAEQGLSLKDLMGRLGQSTPDAALIYLRRSAQADQQAAAALSRMAESAAAVTPTDALSALGLDERGTEIIAQMIDALKASSDSPARR